MDSNDPLLSQLQTEALRRHGFTDSDSVAQLRNLVRLGAAFCGLPALLVLKDGMGVWFQDCDGFPSSCIPDLTRNLILETDQVRLESNGFRVVWTERIMDASQNPIGYFCIASSNGALISDTQRAGLKLLAIQICALSESKQQGADRRNTPRGPAGTSFVPGLAHELRNFVFGISANLDAFEARFSGQEEVGKYGTSIRRNLDRLNAFTEELREYGDPKGFSWTEHSLETVLREVIHHQSAKTHRSPNPFRLHVESSLPAIRMDERRLHSAFLRLTDLALQQEGEDNPIIVKVSTKSMGERAVVVGHLDMSWTKLPEVDPNRIFEPFYFRASGVGRLALPAARRIFEAHGGNLTATLLPNGNLRMNFLLPTV